MQEWNETEKEFMIRLISEDEEQEIFRTESGIRTADGQKNWTWTSLQDDVEAAGSGDLVKEMAAIKP